MTRAQPLVAPHHLIAMLQCSVLNLQHNQRAISWRRHGKLFCPLTSSNLLRCVQVAGLLKEWLRALPEPIVDLHLYGAVLQTQQRRTSVERLNSLQRELKQVGSKGSVCQQGCCPAVPAWAGQLPPRSVHCPWGPLPPAW